jgi:5-methyltetrahydropteroyltriglutamate--homocysteine methyltransferase
MLTHSLGFPRIGLHRELKKAVESFWKGEIDKETLFQKAKELRLNHWRLQHDAGIDLLPVGDFSFYDHILDMTAALGAVPKRYNWEGSEVDLDTYFAMARGTAGEDGGIIAMEMTKWFDTNYHYIVPEFTPEQTFSLSSSKLFNEIREAKEAGFNNIKAVIPGPLTYVYLGKSKDDNFDRWDHLDAIVNVYEEIIARVRRELTWIQIDEPILVLDLPDHVRARFQNVYERLAKAKGEARIMLATYFGDILEHKDIVMSLPIDGLHLDLVRSPYQLGPILAELPSSMTLSLGIVDGRNIWRVDMDKGLQMITKACTALGADRVLLGPSCSLLHVPIDLEEEKKLNPEIRSWMAFAKQKCFELRVLADAIDKKDVRNILAENRKIMASRQNSPLVRNEQVQRELRATDESMFKRSAPYSERRQKQRAHLNLPLFPTTTIGSFPQTAEIRSTRRKFKTGQMSQEDYVRAMQGFIQDTVARQEQIGLDVLVHGEPERNDMVEYFGEQLAGYCFTENGWVPSYGTRCVKPPIIYGDVYRPKTMTVDWITYAQSLTAKPVKGMLTGPITMLCWSFVRDDQPRSLTCKQIAMAIRKEVQDLEKAGVKIIQIDEPALREGLPLKRKHWHEYLDWAVNCFRLATSGVKEETQIHTHMCYCDFEDIIEWIAAMDADVISIEASRSQMTLLDTFKEFKYPNEIGPGIYDIHSPRVPSVEEMVSLLRRALQVIPAERLWVNPDCGLKTRDWAETMASLKNMVEAAGILRKEFQDIERLKSV